MFCALVVSWTTASPGNEVFGCRKHRHIAADFRQNSNRGHWIFIQAWYGTDKVQLCGERFDQRKDFLLNVISVSGELINVLVWHGGMNLLGKADAWDNLIRVENTQAAAELLEMSDMAVNE